jgi:hypothetical protein
MLQLLPYLSRPENLLWLIGIFCIFLVPFLVVYVINKRFERAGKSRSKFSYLFWLALILTITYCVMVSMWSSYNLYHKFSFYGNEVLAFGSFFMYLFILKLRERITEEDPWERLTRFVAPVLLFYVMISVLLIHIIYVGRLATGDSANLPQINPLHFVLSNYGFLLRFIRFSILSGI